MGEINTARFDLTQLRGSFAVQFDAWDVACEPADPAGIRDIRDEIWNAAREQITGEAAKRAGFYVFVNGAIRDITAIVYVGIAKTTRRPLSKRIVDRIMDDSGLDTRLDNFDDATFRMRVSRRLVAALPNSGHKHVDKHLKVAKLFRRSTHALLVGVSAASDAIKATEKVLVGSASAAGATLINDHHRHYPGPVASPERALALVVVNALRAQGMHAEAAEQWRRSIESLS